LTLRVAILDDIHGAWEHTDGVRRLRRRADVAIFTEPFGDTAALRGYEALIANRERTRFDRDLLEALPDVRIIVQTGNHAAHVDFTAARERGITIAQASGGYSIGAAELAIGLTLATMRKIAALDASLRRGEWHVPSTPVLQGKTFGIVGFGRVGAHAARLAQAFGADLLATGRRASAAKAAAQNVEYHDLETVLARADVISIHTSLTPQTRGLIDGRAIALMKPTAYLINTARGPIVDEAALIAALDERRIAGAGLDVFDTEPLPADHALTRLDNVVLTPHIGWPTDDGYERFAAAACDALFAYLDGGDVPQFENH
jgi:phosphoglycerate dehydrogenase-like enzyme